MIDEGLVNVTATDIGVKRGRLYHQLTLGEGDNCSRQTRVTNIDEYDVPWVISFREVGFSDSITESGGSGVVDETKDTQTGDASSVGDSPSLDICVPNWDSQNDVGDANFELFGSDVSKLAQISTDELGSGELLRLTEVFYLGTDGPIDVDQSRVCEGLLNILDLRI